MTAQPQTSREKFSFSSSIAADVWTPKQDPKAYEWWYFDALSDDGRDAVVIIFLDNFIFSPRYNKSASKTNGASLPSAVPAVAFFYYRDGKPLYRAINEFKPDEFSASETEPKCRIGDNSFYFDAVPYGKGYEIELKMKFFGGKQLDARFEWVGIESDFTGGKNANLDGTHNWNLVMPRADVSGRVRILSRGGRETEVTHFRGTGYHDHNFDNRWLPETVQDWQWGRAHFSDSTTVFYRYTECGSPDAVSRLFTVRDGELRDRHADYEESHHSRDIFGVRYPRRMTFATEDGMKLVVEQNSVIDSSFFYLRFLSRMTLTLRDGKTRETVGMTEYLNPKTLRWRWLDWMVSMRIGVDGKGARIP